MLRILLYLFFETENRAFRLEGTNWAGRFGYSGYLKVLTGSS